MGIKNEELATRWLQFGVFSPIMRLHSSSSRFNHKEPFCYSENTAKIMKEYLQLRHKLIPYTYTMNHLCHENGVPFLQPMYYKNPEEDEAYHVPNQYYFGTELIVHPITKPIHQKLGMGKVRTWLPEGIFIDFFTGLIYQGNRNINMYRSIREIPVLAKAGAIVVLGERAEQCNYSDNPNGLEISVFAGENGEFILYEDDGVSMEYENGSSVSTRMELDYRDKQEFLIHASEGKRNLIPSLRSYTIHFRGFTDCKNIEVFTGDREIEFERTYQKESNTVTVTCNQLPVTMDLRIRFADGMSLGDNCIEHRIFHLLHHIQLEFDTIEKIYETVRKDQSPLVITGLQALDLEKELLEALSEIILSYHRG